MSRPLRLEYPDALYHVTSRGDRKENIYEDDGDRLSYLSILSDTIERYRWLCYAYCLMDNHYHLLIQTPEANLSKGMRQLNGVYTQAYNRRHHKTGHLFQGRYKAILVDVDAYLLELSRYIVLNPVKANMVKQAEDWPWSSYLDVWTPSPRGVKLSFFKEDNVRSPYMNQGNLFGIDLSKHSFQGCLINRDNQEMFNRKFTRKSLVNWLSKQKPMMVAIEACGSSHYWTRVIERLGHQVIILAPTSVSGFRLGHKTDATDARAIAIAARQPKLKVVAPKTEEQQGLQGVERIRQHLSDHLTATSNMIRGLLAEFGFVIPKGKKAFKSKVHDLLEDVESELPMPFQYQLIDCWSYYLELETRLKAAEKARDALIKQHDACRQLMQLESVGPVNAMGLYLSLGDRGGSFSNGREASACIGLTPKQHSTGGVVTLGGIGKKSGNRRLRSSLIQGARSVIQKLVKREPRNAKEAWLKSLIERRGEGRAAVALANKTIRVAWAMLHYGEAFRVKQPVSI